MSLTWKIASGPSVGCNMSLRGTNHVISEGSKNSNLYMGPEYVLLGPQESDVWGLSSLSLCSQTQTEGDSSPTNDVRHKLGQTPMIESESNFYCTGSDFNYTGPNSRRVPEEFSFLSNKMDALDLSDSYIHNSFNANSLNNENCLSSVSPFLHDNYNSINHAQGNAGDYHNSLLNYNSSQDTAGDSHILDSYAPLANVLEPDTVSTTTSTSFGSSSSSLVLMDNEQKSNENHSITGETETEVQSAYSGPSDCSVVEISPPRKGLSRFYSGKSRSFSCLADVSSVKDLAKPDNPYARKHRNNLGSGNSSGRPGLPPLQKGSGILKKSSIHNNGKSTLALGLIMSTNDNVKDTEIIEPRSSKGVTKWQRGRSLSFSDLQGVSSSHFCSGA